MNDRARELHAGEFTVSTDRSRLDLDAALAILHATDWAATMPREVLARAIENSVCFGVYRGQELVGLARVVSDLATYAYLTDVVIAEAYRGRGLGRWLVECILAHPDFQSLRRITLLTRDAQGLYARFGFGPLAGTTYMEIAGPRRPDSA